jgi:hypothetical protein
METTTFVASLLRILIRARGREAIRSEEVKSRAATLSLATVMCDENTMSGEDFARATPAGRRDTGEEAQLRR